MSRKWCRFTTPLISVNGRRVDVSYESYDEINQAVISPTQVEVRVPPGAACAVLDDSQSFGGLGYIWTWIDDSTCDITAAGPRVRVKSFVPSTGDPLNAGEPFPVKTTVDPLDDGNGSAITNGWTNAWTPTASVRA